MPTFDDNTYYALQARGAGSQLAPNATQRTTLIIAGVYVIVIAILWYVLPIYSVWFNETYLPRHVPYLSWLSAFRSASIWLSFLPFHPDQYTLSSELCLLKLPCGIALYIFLSGCSQWASMR